MQQPDTEPASEITPTGRRDDAVAEDPPIAEVSPGGASPSAAPGGEPQEERAAEPAAPESGSGREEPVDGPSVARGDSEVEREDGAPPQREGAPDATVLAGSPLFGSDGSSARTDPRASVAPEPASDAEAEQGGVSGGVPGTRGYLFADVVVRSPRDELEHLFRNRLRCHEDAGDAAARERLARAYALAKEKLAEQLGEVPAPSRGPCRVEPGEEDAE